MTGPSKRPRELRERQVIMSVNHRRFLSLHSILVAVMAAVVLLGACQPVTVPEVAEPPRNGQAATPNISSSRGNARSLLKSLEIAEPIDNGSYDRDLFGDGWADLDSDGCETRDEILARDLDNVQSPDGCDVKAGTLRDPYTDRTIGFQDDQWWTVHVDHIYPLAHAWRLGASEWSENRRLEFANDPANLLAVDGPTNSSKGDSGPAEWVPLNRIYACTYARKYVEVAAAYELPVTAGDRESLALLIDTCPS